MAALAGRRRLRPPGRDLDPRRLQATPPRREEKHRMRSAARWGRHSPKAFPWRGKDVHHLV